MAKSRKDRSRSGSAGSKADGSSAAAKPAGSSPDVSAATKSATSAASKPDSGSAAVGSEPRAAPDTAADRAAALAELAFDRRRHGDVERELAQLSPAEARVFLRLIEISMRKRRILLAGYLLCLVVVIGATLCALYLYALDTPGLYIGWALLVPLALVGVILYAFGRWAHRE